MLTSCQQSLASASNDGIDLATELPVGGWGFYKALRGIVRPRGPYKVSGGIFEVKGGGKEAMEFKEAESDTTLGSSS